MLAPPKKPGRSVRERNYLWRMATNVFRIDLIIPDVPVTRTVRLPADYPATDLRDVVDVVMQWDGFDDVTYNEPKTGNPLDEPTSPAELVRMATGGVHIFYHGSRYEVNVILTGQTDEQIDHPEVTEATGYAPPEDIPSVADFYRHLEAYFDPTDELHAAVQPAFGRNFPRQPDVDALNEELAGLDEEIDDTVIDLLLGNPEDLLDPDDFYEDEEDLDLEWLENTTGIRLSDDNVYDIPEDVLDLYEETMSADPMVDDMETIATMLEREIRAHPDNLSLRLLLVGHYTRIGKPLKARQLQDKLPRPEDTDNLEYVVNILDTLPDELLETVAARMPQPLDVRNYAAGREGRYPIDMFLTFETQAVRYLLITEDYPAALRRFERLVRTGFLPGDVEFAGRMVAAYQLMNPKVIDRYAEEASPIANELLMEFRDELEITS